MYCSGVPPTFDRSSEQQLTTYCADQRESHTWTWSHRMSVQASAGATRYYRIILGFVVREVSCPEADVEVDQLRLRRG